LKELRD
jgi:hypothetical protein